MVAPRLGARFGALLLAGALALGFAAEAAARDWTLGPEDGADAIKDLLSGDRVAGGDRLLLKSGEYGSLFVKKARFDTPVEIVSTEPSGSAFERIRLHESAGLTLRGLRVRGAAGGNPDSPLVQLSGGSQGIVLENLDVRTIDGDGSNWSREDWRRRARNGIRLSGSDNVLRNSRIGVVQHGIDVGGRRNLIEHNVVDGFSGDGLRVNGDEMVARGNTIQNCFKVDDNHDDGIQSFTRGPGGKVGAGVIKDVVLSGNRILEWTRPPSPLRCRLQGIGLFDGVYDDWTIENNLVVVRHLHGITVMGGRDLRIVNNTVVNPEGVRQKGPRIWLRPHKDGRSFEGNVVANNLASRFITADALDHQNHRILYPVRLFRAPQNLDYRLKTTGVATNAADRAWQPPADIEGRPRPAEGGDPGAFQR